MGMKKTRTTLHLACVPVGEAPRHPLFGPRKQRLGHDKENYKILNECIGEDKGGRTLAWGGCLLSLSPTHPAACTHVCGNLIISDLKPEPRSVLMLAGK